MRLHFNIEENEEFRKHIRNAIDGQIRGIVREEFTRVVNEEVQRIARFTRTQLDEALKVAATRYVKHEVKKNLGGDFQFNWNTDWVVDAVSKIIDNKFKQNSVDIRIDKEIDKKVKELVDKLMNK